MVKQQISNLRSRVRFSYPAPSYSPIAQSVEQQTVNLLVPGSSPGWGANISKRVNLIVT